MPACIRIEAEALKLHITVDELRRLVNTGLIEIIESDGGCFLTKESASKAQLILELLRTRRLNLTQIAQILARRAPPYRLDDVRWI
jgi:Mn-dependent DtxR family transcriptional regulator